MLEYKLIQTKIEKPHYIITMQAKTCMGSVLGYPNVAVFCSEEELFPFLEKFSEFLKDEERDHIIYDFDDTKKRYVEMGKSYDPHADGGFYLMYAIHSIQFIDESSNRFDVIGWK